MGISVVINTCNSAGKIGKVIDAVKDFDEVLICDMGSTDNTTAIAKEKGCRVISFLAPGAISADPARNFAISAAKRTWVLIVDPEEIITPQLRDYLYEFIQQPENIKALYIPRRNFILHKFKKSSYPDYQLRFFEKDAVYWPSDPFSTPKINGNTFRIPAAQHEKAIIHLPCTFAEGLQKANRRTSGDVKRFVDNNKKVTLFRIVFEPLWCFIQTYFFKGSCRYGIAGYISARHDCTYRYFRLVKLYEQSVRHLVPCADDLINDDPEL